MAWHSAARSLEREGIPREFVTTSRVVIICNDWKMLNRNVVAFQDQGHMVVFEPTAEEVHRKTEEWFEDEAIYGWFGENLHLLTEPSMRQYLRAAELKGAGMDWMQIVPLAPEDERQRLVAELEADTSFGTEEARVREFVARGVDAGRPTLTALAISKKMGRTEAMGKGDGPQWLRAIADGQSRCGSATGRDAHGD